MRIERLHLLRYRALADVALDFAPGPRVHLVYGPQEAGKTTALAAITDALFGFPHQGVDAGRFKPAELRVEMHLAAGGGARLAFRRRKGRERTLLPPDESGHLPDHVLGPYLGTLDRSGFERTFGLTSQRLREAGVGLEASGGDTGAALFAASSGLAGLGRLTDDLEGDADALFGVRRKAARRFTQEETRHDEARRRESEAQLTGSRWSELRRQLADLEEREAVVNATRAEGLRTIRHLELLLRLAPIHGRIRALEVRLAEFDDLAAVPHDELTRLERLTREKHDAIVEEARAAETLERERARLAAVAVDEACLDHAEVVEALVRRSGAVEKAVGDLPRVAAERDEYARELQGLAGKLGLDPAALHANVPSVPMLARLGETVRVGRQLENERRTTDESLAAARKGLAEAGDTPPDPTRLRRRLDALAPDLARLNGLDERRETLAQAEGTVRHDAAALVPAVMDVEAARDWQLPDDATLAGAAAALAAASDAAAAGRRELARTDERRAALRHEIERGADGDIVTREAIEAARAERDAALGDGLTGTARDVLVRRADELADRAFAKAEAVARHEARVGELAGLDAERTRLAAEAGAADVAVGEARASFDALFPLSVVEPERMARWVERVRDLRERWRGVEDARRAVASLEALDGMLRPALLELASDLGCHADLPTPALARLVADAVGEREARWNEHLQRRTLRAERARRLEELEHRAADATVRMEAWRKDLAAANTACGLDAAFGLAEAEAAGELWRRVPDLVDMQNKSAARVAGMERDRDAFEADVAAAVMAIDPALSDLATATAIERLSARCRDAAHSATRRREIERAVAQAVTASQDASLAADAAQARLDAAAAALMGEEVDLAPVIERLGARGQLHGEMERQRTAFHEAAGGHEVDEGELVDLDPVATELRLETERAQADAQEAEARDLHAELVTHRNEAAALQRAGGAEEHAFARLGAAADMATTGREWLVLRAARHLLDLAVARQRERESGPLMARAGALFASLTGGSFARLEQDWDGADAPRIVGVRPSDERVAMDGMSEGTHDQLFLALRLAHLEAHAAANEPMPFVADDIFMTFDRERTRHGLRALAEVADAFQPILFTHHDFVVDEARAALGDTLDLVDLSAARVAEPV